MKNHQDRVFEFPPDLEFSIEEGLHTMGIGLNEVKKIAKCIHHMSDFYLQNPEAKTPWNETWAQIAQMSYYFPLNTLRALSVIEEGHRLGFFAGLTSLIDFGSGLGAGSWYLSEIDKHFFVESSQDATRLHQKLRKDLRPLQWQTHEPRKIEPNSLALFSYSLTELHKLPDWISQCEAVMLIEPSTRQDGRRLLEYRQMLIELGFSIWAPCTHQGPCPLLNHSPTDWCHDRIHLKSPQWFLDVEAQLPFRNQTLTMSYLLARKEKPASPLPGRGRLVGDRLDEKGKSRQLFCRGPEREFLAWLHRNGSPPLHPRGILFELPDQYEIKSNEIRLS